MDPVYKIVAEVVKSVGLTPACLVAIVALVMQYRQNIAKDRVIETMAASLEGNTRSVIKVKTIIEAFLARGGLA